MTPTESVTLCRLVKAACPQQAIDPLTPDIWADLLSDLQYTDAEVAVKTLAQRQPFIAPAEIRTEVRRVRTLRLANAPAIQPPADLDPDDELAYRRWLRGTRAAIADGRLKAVPELLPARDMSALDELFPAPEVPQ